MLYCPKCNHKYKEGEQRFCNNDGSRLLPETSHKRQSGSKDNFVFSGVLNRTRQVIQKEETPDTTAASAGFIKPEQSEIPFEPPPNSKIFKSEPESSKIQIPKTSEPKAFKKEPEIIQQIHSNSRLIRSNEIKIDRAELGDRRTKPTGRAALSRENAGMLLGKSIKGRYRISEILEQDDASIAYLADDQIHKGKKAVVRVLMEENSGESLEDKIFVEERVSLSHINHPNIAKFIDSGELPEGKPFIVTEFAEGESVRELLDNGKELNPMRIARIISQAASALSEVHQNGILHRNLKPEHILLSVNEGGKETVKVTGFSVSGGGNSKNDLVYSSPEQVGGQLPTFSSDTYSLGVIAYEMLTGEKPFDSDSARSLLKLQKKGLANKLTQLKPELPALADKIIKKTLAFNAYERYPKARDFGDALYNSLMTVPPWEGVEEKLEDKDSVAAQTSDELFEKLKPINPTDEILETSSGISTETSTLNVDKHIPLNEPNLIETRQDVAVLDIGEENQQQPEIINPSKGNTLWEKRSSEPTKKKGNLFTLLSVLGAIVLVIGVAVWQYFGNRNVETEQSPTPNQEKILEEKAPTIQTAKDPASADTNQADNIEVPPPEREITPPPNSKFYENLKQNLDTNLAKNYRGFSVYFPKSWEQNEQKTNFLDISKKAENGLPKEQLLITHYDSNGTFDLDQKKFPELVEKSNKDLKEAPIPDYQVVSEGEITVNNGWKSYEVKFKGKTKFKDREIEIWGKRIWIPAARPGVKHGIVITMLATSLSDRIQSLDDVGKKGDLGDILYSFEPDRNY